jgi:hypothetical protein
MVVLRVSRTCGSRSTPPPAKCEPWCATVPVFIGRGVVQLSAYVDTVLASLRRGPSPA